MIFSIILIIPAFILWGVPNRTKGRKYAGIVSGKKVSWREYYKNLQACEHRAVLIYGNKYQEMRKNLELEEQAWQNLLLLKKAKTEGIEVNDQELIKTIEGIALFQNEQGFNKEKYRQVLQYLRVAPRQFEEEIRDSLKISKLTDSNIGKIDANDEEVKKFYVEENEGKDTDFKFEEEKFGKEKEIYRLRLLWKKRAAAQKRWLEKVKKEAGLISHL